MNVCNNKPRRKYAFVGACFPLCVAALAPTLAAVAVSGCGHPASVHQASVIELPQLEDLYFKQAQHTLNHAIAQRANENLAKNVVLIVGDGFGLTSIVASRIYEGQSRNIDGESNVLAFEAFPNLALAKTYSHNMQTPDSASTATAMVSGVKTNSLLVGMDSTAVFNNCTASQNSLATSIFELAEQAGLSTGVVSTARITHATPASVYGHAPSRGWEADADLSRAQDNENIGTFECKDLARQLVEWPYGDGLEVALGGGRENFLPQTKFDPEYSKQQGRRVDGRDLTEDWLSKYGAAGAFVWRNNQFKLVTPERTDHLLGLFEPSHMQFEHDRPADAAGEPSLAEMTSKAIDILQTNNAGFFLMVEGGRIDHASHLGNAYRLLTDAVALNEAVKTVLEKVDLNETLVIVTADHSHTMTISGYTPRGNPILGIARGSNGEPRLAKDNKPYTTLSFANGPGATIGNAREDLGTIDTTDPDFKQPAAIPLRTETHGGEDVVIYATGPWSHLFRNTVEQNYIFHVINHAARLEHRKNANLLD